MNSNNSQLKSKMTNGFSWKFGEKISSQIIQFVLQIVLARILGPEEFGIVGILIVFINLSEVFIIYGFTTALIQKKQVDDIDLSTVFFANFVLSVFIYAILFFIAPLISCFYEEPALTSLMRILSINLIISSFSVIQNSIVSRRLDFKVGFIKSLCGVIVQGCVGIILAINGFGVWSLVLSKVAGTIMSSLVLVLFVRWFPKSKFSLIRLKALFSYSWKLLVTNLLGSLFQNASALVVGKVYSTTDLGYYQKGQQFPQTAMAAVDGSLSEVLYPSFSSIQDNLPLVKRALSRSIRLSMYLVIPMLVGGIVIAKPLVILLLGAKWEPCIPFFQLQCLVCLFWPLSARNHALNSIGKSNITLITSVVSNVISLLFIFIGAKYSIYLVLIGVIIANFLTLFLSSYFVNKYIGYSLLNLVVDIIKPLMLSIFMGICVYLIMIFKFETLITIIIQIIVGIIIYIGASYLFRFEQFTYICNLIKERIHKNNK